MTIGLPETGGAVAPERDRGVEAQTVRRPAHPDSDPRVEAGRTGGILLVFLALAFLPGAILRGPAHPAAVIVPCLAGLACGLVCLRAPWERLSSRWLHAVCVLATLEVAVVVGAADWAYQWLYLFVVLYATYALGSHGATLQVALVGAALVAPAVYAPEAARDAIRVALVAVPTVIVVWQAVARLRARLDAKQRLYRRFAEETLTLALRIEGRRIASVAADGATGFAHRAAAPGEHPADALLRDASGRS